jgi:hypothetical protein
MPGPPVAHLLENPGVTVVHEGDCLTISGNRSADSCARRTPRVHLRAASSLPAPRQVRVVRRLNCPALRPTCLDFNADNEAVAKQPLCPACSPQTCSGRHDLSACLAILDAPLSTRRLRRSLFRCSHSPAPAFLGHLDGAPFLPILPTAQPWPVPAVSHVTTQTLRQFLSDGSGSRVPPKILRYEVPQRSVPQ